MTRYYYNENPQVRHWMEKCAILQQEIDITREELEDIEKRYERRSNNFFKLTKQLIAFNNAPWYRKMFFKFKI